MPPVTALLTKVERCQGDVSFNVYTRAPLTCVCFAMAEVCWYSVPGRKAEKRDSDMFPRAPLRHDRDG